MDMTEKLSQLMKELDINRAELSKNTGIPYTTIDGLFKKGTENIKRSTLTKLAKFFDVTIDYLANDAILDKNYNKSIGFKVDYNEMTNIKKYRELNPLMQGAVDNLIDYLHSNKDEMDIGDADINSKKNKRIIPFYSLPASAGIGEYLDSSFSEMIEIPTNPLYDDADFAVRVNGDSMEPFYKDGCTVLVREQPSIDFGDIGIFVVNDEGYIKKHDRRGLVSLNPKYDIIRINEYDTFKISGKVIAILEQEAQ